MAGERRPTTLEERMYKLEVEVSYFKQDIERQFATMRAHNDQQFGQLSADIRSIPATSAISDFRDPRQWGWVIAGIIGGFIILFVTLYIATGGFA